MILEIKISMLNDQADLLQNCKLFETDYNLLYSIFTQHLKYQCRGPEGKGSYVCLKDL